MTDQKKLQKGEQIVQVPHFVLDCSMPSAMPSRAVHPGPTAQATTWPSQPPAGKGTAPLYIDPTLFHKTHPFSGFVLFGLLALCQDLCKRPLRCLHLPSTSILFQLLGGQAMQVATLSHTLIRSSRSTSIGSPIEEVPGQS